MELEEREREKTGIKNLKIKFNKVFGYYLDVTNSYKDLVPDHYIRKQTLANSERYTTEELNQLADTILGSEDRLYALEYETYVMIRETLAGEMERISRTANVIAPDRCTCLPCICRRTQSFCTSEVKCQRDD